MLRFTLVTILIAACAIGANAQNLSQTGASPLAVTGISQPGKFPIKISKSGSYRLNNNLTVKSGVSADAIDVLVPNVTIDLSGFTITGGLVAINALTSDAANVTVSGGSIAGSGAGVLLADGAVVRNVRVSGVTGSAIAFSGAIVCGSSCTVTGNTVYDVTPVNSGAPPSAIAVGSNSLVSNNTVTGTIGGSSVGVGIGSNSLVSGNTICNNANTGILAFGSGVMVSHNTISNNLVGLNFPAVAGGFENNILINNGTDVTGTGTSLAGGNTNLCTSGVC